ncbi:MAG: N-acetylmuramoyl-L-alanine amidase [Sphingomonadaceae bacterium]
MTGPVPQRYRSPNWNERQLPVSMVVLHYTGMKSAEAALERLCDEEAGVSAHYLIDEDGTLFALVDEDKRAWHAGKSYWRGVTDINSASIGIELVNPGHEFGYRPFPDAQINILIPLLADIMRRHDVPRANVVAHSDIAPARKEDPGELFPWDRLAEYRLCLPRPEKLRLGNPFDNDGAFYLALERFGYDVTDGRKAVAAFQRRWRPRCIDGEVDGEVRAILFALLLDRDRGTTR